MNKLSLLKQYFFTKHIRKFTSREDIVHFQNKQIKKHINYVVEHSPFYRHYYQKNKDDIIQNNWTNLPIINKEIMMTNFDDFNTVGIKREQAFAIAAAAEKTRDFSPKLKDVSIGLSSGTSGNRGLFLVSDHESAVWAGTVLAKLLPGGLFSKQTIAFFLRANNNLYSSTENGRIAFHYFDLLDDIQNHLVRLQEIQPTIMIGPPSMLRKIAEWQNENNLRISPVKIVSVAEVLEDIDKRFIEQVFNQIVHQVYQCTEGFLASTCSYGTLHLNEDIVAVQKEYLNREKGIFVPIITDFTRTSQPIIRYRLNDLLIEKGTQCPCGSYFLALERIDGRCDDLFYGYEKTSRNVKLIFPDYIRRAIMLASDKIQEYKVIQKGINRIDIHLKVNNNIEIIKDSVLEELLKMWRSLQLEEPTFQFYPYDMKPSVHKMKRIENVMKEQFEGKIL